MCCFVKGLITFILNVIVCGLALNIIMSKGNVFSSSLMNSPH